MNYDKEFLSYIEVIINDPEFQKRKTYMHHHDTSVYEHSMQVAYKAFLYAKKHKMDAKSAAIGGVLHDFYYKDWHIPRDKKEKFFEQHGFAHAREALDNSKRYFPDLVDDRVENIILRHMFPLNIRPPKYKEAWVVTLMDKLVSLEVIKHPKEYHTYLGIGGKKK
ncbi:MAG: HD domain-containing protein [Bacilli bacterium]|nr:HD domain-containing protein [Bacilli bacterium]